jgi:hypothetical protein
MDRPVTPDEARAALDTIERSRLRVIDEIDVPWWYWWGLALGWIALGVIADVGPAWLSSVATFVFGAAHATAAPRVISGRHASRDLSVRATVAPPHLARIVIGALLALGALTVGLALLAQADGAEHPVTIASVLVAVIIVLGGPLLLSIARQRAARSAVAR